MTTRDRESVAWESYETARLRVLELLDDAAELNKLPVGVSLWHEDGAWFCECESLDYFSQGSTPVEAIRHFRAGLQETILVNLLKHGRFEPTPRGSSETWIREGGEIESEKS